MDRSYEIDREHVGDLLERRVDDVPAAVDQKEIVKTELTDEIPQHRMNVPVDL